MKIWKTSGMGKSISLPTLAALAAHHVGLEALYQAQQLPNRKGERWDPSTRPRPSTALREVADELRRVNNNPNLPMDRRARLELEGDAWLCMTTMLAGHGNEETWGVIVKNLNVAMILTELGYGEELYDLLKDAMAGAFRAQIRAKRSGRWGFDGPAAASIREALEYHQVQLQAASKAHVYEALQIMNQRLADGNVYTDADAQT
jgi:hypothetical protein